MSDNKKTKPYQSLIYLGCGETPNIDEYLALADNIWLIDADSRAIDSLSEAAGELENVHIVHALVDTEERAGTFYRYNLPWANGRVPVNSVTKQLYPGLRILDSEEQTTTPVDRLLSQCLPQQENTGKHMLFLDVGDSNSGLLQALEEAGLLARLQTVIVLPAHRKQPPVVVPPSLCSTGAQQGNLALPENAEFLTRHPLLNDLEQGRRKLAEFEDLLQKKTNNLEEVTDKLLKSNATGEELTQERDRLKQQLIERDAQLTDLNRQLAEATAASEIEAAEHAKVLKIEQEKTIQLEKERDQYLSQRDEEWHKGERLAEERDEAKRQLEQAIAQRDDALSQIHLPPQGKKTLEEVEADGFYRALEDKFRGARETIKKRVNVYLPFVEPIAERHPGVPALDLGCGRGEWLEALKDAGIPCEGVDQDAGMLEGCQALGLTVQQGDAITFLQAQADASRICISLIHVVEHIPFDMLRLVVSEAKRVLVPDGILIMETPNPENLTVGACNFYMDPTHRNPLPPPLLAFVPEYSGFECVKVLRLQEKPVLHHKTHFGINDLLAGVSPDYAVLARVKQITGDTPTDQKDQAVWDREYGISLANMVQRNTKHDNE